MEHLQYVIEDSTLAELLGVQNFTNDESAVLELIKNSYDAKASELVLQFDEKEIVIIDNGIGMNDDDIRQDWMHVGKSAKKYEVIDEYNNKRVLAGSKGVGRFALSRLGAEVEILSKKEGYEGISWNTDWCHSTLQSDSTLTSHGTRITIGKLREKWTEKKVTRLVDFISKTYNDTCMKIRIVHPNVNTSIKLHFPQPVLGENCVSSIILKYDSSCHLLQTEVYSDEFNNDAKLFCKKIDLNHYCITTNMVEEMSSSKNWDLSNEELSVCLEKIGDFSGELYFNIVSTKVEMEKFMYKYASVPNNLPSGIILYRNAFSISSYEGKRDWLGLGKRSRKSPAAASHPTGSWRIRENQLSGKIIIDKKENEVLQDLSNRQGLDENIYYELFVEIILTGIKEFERYRQSIIRLIDTKNSKNNTEISKPVSEKVIANPNTVSNLSIKEAKQLVDEIKTYRKESSNYKRERVFVEERYKYDVRILNVLATSGLKASSIAHELNNDRNSISDNVGFIISALQEYDMWDNLQAPERTAKTYKNVPYLLECNRKVTQKIVAFMDTMLAEIEKKQFEALWQSIADILSNIKCIWERDYAFISINFGIEEDICFFLSEDTLQVIFDNLILNSIQQNEDKNHLNINITAKLMDDKILFVYSDDGKGLDKKYFFNPRKILEVHETTRKKGHGLGMWIVNNTVVMSGGEITNIQSTNGFSIEFLIGGRE